MSVITGIQGRVKAGSVVANTRLWNLSSSMDLAKVVSSLTKGGPARSVGNVDCSGTYQAYGHTPVIMPKDTFTFEGVLSGTDGADSVVASVDVICNQVEITIDIEAGAIIEHTVSFEGNGAVSFLTAQTVALDDTALIGPSSIGCIVKFASDIITPTYAERVDVRTVTITISSENPPYVSSGTAGATKRVGGNIDASISISVYEDDYNNLPDLGEVNGIQVYVDGSTFWEFLWGTVGEHSDLEVNRETADLIAATINFSYTGIAGSGVAGALEYGTIKNPATTTWWPV